MFLRFFIENTALHGFLKRKTKSEIRSFYAYGLMLIIYISKSPLKGHTYLNKAAGLFKYMRPGFKGLRL